MEEVKLYNENARLIREMIYSESAVMTLPETNMPAQMWLLAMAG
ncbi:MAG: hypothetical protein QE272_04680 [Nevskia sp.]|nr:hypothetical protein [Nevskia sp.]